MRSKLSPEQTVEAIDPSLRYVKWTRRGASNVLYKVEREGESLVLKLYGGLPRFMDTEVRGFQELQGVTGIPRVVRIYRPDEVPRGNGALLREYVEGTELDIQQRGIEVYNALLRLIVDLDEHANMGLPRDCKPEQFIADSSGQPHLIDIEETPFPNYDADYRKVKQLRRKIDEKFFKKRRKIVGIPLPRSLSVSLNHFENPLNEGILGDKIKKHREEEYLRKERDTRSGYLEAEGE